jgi:hypothetical protein
VANLLKGLIDEASEISSSTQNDSKSETLSKMLNLLASLMSDRSSVMKKSNVIDQYTTPHPSYYEAGGLTNTPRHTRYTSM